jgi:hypothetical protein
VTRQARFPQAPHFTGFMPHPTFSSQRANSFSSQRTNSFSSQRTNSFSIPTSDTSDLSAPSRLRALFQAALNDYEKKTGIALDKHPLAKDLQDCDSVESVTAVLSRQTQAFSEFREKDKILKPLKNTLSILHKLSVAAKFGQNVGLVRRQALGVQRP